MTKEEQIRVLEDELHHTKVHLEIEGKAGEYYAEMRNIAESLEAAVAEMKRSTRPAIGTWINVEKHKIIDDVEVVAYSYEGTCDQCSYRTNITAYCPNCGAEMYVEGGENSYK